MSAFAIKSSPNGNGGNDLRKELAKLEKQLSDTVAAYQKLWAIAYPPDKPLASEWTPTIELNARELDRLRRKTETLQQSRDELAARVAARDSAHRRAFANMGVTVPPPPPSSSSTSPTQPAAMK
jgi:hypothetical protein